MPRPFIIFALPRSRTAWLAHFLSYGSKRVGHDIVIECKKAQDFLDSFANGMDGTVETGAVEGWEYIHARMPQAKFITIHRPLVEVKVSLAKLGITPAPGELEARETKLQHLARLPWVESLLYEDLNIPQCCRWLFEYTLELPWDPEWHKRLAKINIQIDMQARLDQLHRNHEAMQVLRNEIADARD